ncbi:MAG: exodeoxyribonuclease V subunit gamma [Clostridia bacterium]|nr:exodeoxyribonuclease V subunit gamma [Clostridia bacterium]
MIKLITTDSYFNLFSTLNEQVEKSSKDLTESNVIFCESKVSLMIERLLCNNVGGSFNTDVYSFGSFLRKEKTLQNMLSKEGSAMAVKSILAKCSLKCFKHNKTTLSVALYELIMQLKSAKIMPEDVFGATEQVNGVLKNKLLDVALVYGEYEKFIIENGFEDQSSQLSYLPELLATSDKIKNANVYIVGYHGFTMQMRSAIETIIKTAKNVTAIMVEGDNPFVFVNETADFFRAVSKKTGVRLQQNFIKSDYTQEGELLLDNLFNPTLKTKQYGKTNPNDKFKKIDTDKIFVESCKNPQEEINKIAEIIKRAVISGKYRYRDISIAISNPDDYRDEIKSAFTQLGVPYFLDEQKSPLEHPLVALVLAFLDVKRRGYERDSLLRFIKNPLVIEDKTLADTFENYLIKYNVNYGRIFKEFIFEKEDEEKFNVLESIRAKLCPVLEIKDVYQMLLSLNVKDKLDKLADTLDDVGEKEQASVTRQIYDEVIKILDEMDALLGDTKISIQEYKSVFLSGVNALKLSIIPQYNDAVFIGGYKEVALAKAKILFAPGLTVDVPFVKDDVAMLSDADINRLQEIKVLVEPKIRVVNHRVRENTAMAMASFSDTLYLSYPLSNVDGKHNYKSEILTCVEKLFDVQPFPAYDGYLTQKQGLNSFAKACGEFSEGAIQDGKHYDFTVPSSYSQAVGVEKLTELLNRANKEIKKRLSGNRSLVKNVTSPTTLEHYYQCPYRAFIEHGLKIKGREEGRVDALSVGNLMHEVFKNYVENINEVFDEKTSNELFEKIKLVVLEDEVYKKFLSDPASKCSVDRILRESKNYCYKTFRSLSASNFNKCKTEVGFGEGRYCDYPAINLLDGKVKLKGKIDRVDEGDKYFRVLDYKTGKADASEKLLFAGVKLQLYLYAEAVRSKYKGDSNKQPVGLYYLPVSDKYDKEADKSSVAVGKTLDTEQAILVQDKNYFNLGKDEYSLISTDKRTGKVKGVTEQTLNSYVDYAVKIAELAAKRMDEGVMVASPFSDACKYCEYRSMCEFDEQTTRNVGGVNDQTFVQSQGGDK